ncbi:hypothetical protein [Nocardiopsis sp. CA-288880]|uniref:hypothetical protein n=1 Tax=Nocardiopsis sp. CA-288880 TaxID=3239995 RepID=UPI003D951E01
MPQRTLDPTAVLPSSEAPPSAVSAPAARRPSDTPSPAPGPVSLEGIGDVVDAGRPSGYAHLGERRLPTLGRLVAAARGAASSLRRPTLWPTRRGHWQPAPRAARRHASGRLRVTTVALEPNSFVSGPADHPARPHGMEVLYLVSGRAHLIASAPDGQMRSASELAEGRARVVGAPAGGTARGHHFLVNTGDEVAVVVRVTA